MPASSSRSTPRCRRRSATSSSRASGCLPRGISFIKLVPWDQRERSQQEIVDELRPLMGDVPGVQRLRGQPGAARPGRQLDAGALRRPDLAALRGAAGDGRSADGAGAREPRPGQRRDRPQARQAAAQRRDQPRQGRRHGGRRRARSAAPSRPWSAVARSRASSATASSTTSSSRSADADRATPDDLQRIYVRGADGQMVPLSNLVSVTETVAPQELEHFNQLRSATLEANLAPGYSLGEALAFLEQAASEVLPPEAQHRLFGPVARVQGGERRALSHLRPRARLHLPGALGSVRELPQPASSSC